MYCVVMACLGVFMEFPMLIGLWVYKDVFVCFCMVDIIICINIIRLSVRCTCVPVSDTLVLMCVDEVLCSYLYLCRVHICVIV